MSNSDKLKVDIETVSKDHNLPLTISIALKSLLLSGIEEDDKDKKDNLQRAKFFIERELLKYN